MCSTIEPKSSDLDGRIVLQWGAKDLEKIRAALGHGAGEVAWPPAGGDR